MATALFVLPPREPGGNRTTALRWAKILRSEGWHVARSTGRAPGQVDLIVALHATKTREVVSRLRRTNPGAPVVLGAAGTDLYVDLPGGGPEGRLAAQAFEDADRIVVLQEQALDCLPPDQRPKARVLNQSTPRLEPIPEPDEGCFEALMLAGVRGVKDPACAAEATTLLPPNSRIVLHHFGPGRDPELEERLRGYTSARYKWHGTIRRREALCRIGRSRVLVCPSLQEGGANVVTEALAQGTAVLATRVGGTVGLLGEDHPGLFPAGDSTALAVLLQRCEEDPDFLGELSARSQQQAWLTAPERELEGWRLLLQDLLPGSQGEA